MSIPERAIIASLQSGGSVIRVYSSEDFYPRSWHTHEDNFVLSWRFIRENSTLLVNEELFVTLPNTIPETQGPALQKYLEVDASVARFDRNIMFPWTPYADGTLLCHHVRQHHALTPLYLFHDPKVSPLVYSVVTDPSSEILSLLTITYQYPSPNDGNKLTMPTFTFPDAPYSSSPSTGFGKRLALLQIIVFISRNTLFVLDASYWLTKALAATVLLWFFAVIVLPIWLESPSGRRSGELLRSLAETLGIRGSRPGGGTSGSLRDGSASSMTPWPDHPHGITQGEQPEKV